MRFVEGDLVASSSEKLTKAQDVVDKCVMSFLCEVDL